MKTFTALARDYCANWCDGICNGVEFNLNGSQMRFLEEGSRCLLVDGKACHYFEECVLPMEKWEWKNPSEGKKFREGVHEYYLMHVPPEPPKRKCPSCKKVPLLRGQQRCDVCSEKRRKEVHAKAKQQYRSKIAV